MSAEPNHKMEDQLKAYAQKRRADAGDSLELHPATRRLLQAEVAKLRPNPPAASRSWLWAWRMFWARPGFALLLFLMLGVAAWFLLRTAEKPRSREQFAKRRTDLAPVPALSETGRDKSQALPPAPTKALDFSEGRTADELELKQQAAPAAKNESGDDVRRNFTIATPAATPLSTAGKEVKLVEELAHNQPLPLAAEPSLGDSAARTGNLTAFSTSPAQVGGVIWRERYVQVRPGVPSVARKKFADVKSTVLVSFDLEQTGEQLRVVDGDGSIYDGRVLVGAPAEAGMVRELELSLTTAARSEAAKKPDSKMQSAGKDERVAGSNASASARRFRVSGTNRTLRLPVVLEGVLFTPAEQQSLPMASAGRAVVADGQTAPSALSRGTTRSLDGPAAPVAAPGLVPAGNVPNQVASVGQRMTSAAAATNLLSLPRIQGKLSIGPTNEMLLEAVPAGKE